MRHPDDIKRKEKIKVETSYVMTVVPLLVSVAAHATLPMSGI
jgi:hypothetical protein